MAQKSIREFDAKKLFGQFCNKSYDGYLITSEDDLLQIPKLGRWVIKPDQLFWKRGKLWLLWLNLTYHQLVDRFHTYNQKKVVINDIEDCIDTYIVEPYFEHKDEYYISFITQRDCDVISFSAKWWIDIEENQQYVQKMFQPINQDITLDQIQKEFVIADLTIAQFIYDLFSFFRTYGFSYLEINPFVKDNNDQIQLLDMVWKLDSCEFYKQKQHRNGVQFHHAFGMKKSLAEQQIEKIDAESGASLKFNLLNPNWSLWFILGGGGASVIFIDTVCEMGYVKEVWNYWELSWNPTKEENMLYAKYVIEQLLASTATNKILCIVWWISNFTRIDHLFEWICDAIIHYHDDLQKQNISILVRRWWVQEDEWIDTISNCCKKYNLYCIIENSDTYMTTILDKIKL